MRTAAVILNAAAGAAAPPATDQLIESMQAILSAAGLRAEFVLAKSIFEIQHAARDRSQKGYSPVVAGGGDGTVSAVAAVLAGSGVPLGILPVGTLNHFAKDLRIPLNPAAAAKLIVSGRVQRVDVGEVNGRVFINNSSLGLYPTIVQERQKLQRRGTRKWPAFLWAAASAFRRYPFLRVRLDVDGYPLERRTPFVFVGNNEYLMEGFQIGSRPSLQQGTLCLYVTHRIGRLGLLRLSLRALARRLRQSRDFDMMLAREVWIETRRSPVAVAYDGEVEWMEPPLHYRIRKADLAVIAPDA